MSFLVPAFFIVSLLYAMVGFGGGSSYIALLALSDLSYEVIPQIALLCNIIVVLGGCYHFTKRGHFSWPLFWPFIAASVPMAFIGGFTPISESVFFLLLGLSLFAAGLRLIFVGEVGEKKKTLIRFNRPMAFILGGGIGLLSGMVGIGGGIFLAPILLVLGWGTAKQVATTASFFILLNSLAGLAGHLSKQGSFSGLADYAPLFITVLIGGQIGSRLGSGVKVPNVQVRRLTAVLVILVSVRLLYRVLS